MQTAIPKSGAVRALPVPGADSGSSPTTSATASRASRVASLLYGSLTYVLFLLTFLYAIGFVSGLLVPKTVDGGASVPLVEAWLVNGGFLALFAVQHTIMARKAFKRRWTRIVPAQIEPATFVLAASVILGTMFWQWRLMPGTIREVRGPVAPLLRAASFLGWGMVLFGRSSSIISSSSDCVRSCVITWGDRPRLRGSVSARSTDSCGTR